MGCRRVLFVCAGNTCRSPLAAALARKHLPEVAAESAGITPGFGIAEHTVVLAAELAGIDLGDYVPRDIADVNVHSFETVIALDRLVADALKDQLSSSQRLILWDIEDPYGGTMENYRRTAEEILSRLPDIDI